MRRICHHWCAFAPSLSQYRATLGWGFAISVFYGQSDLRPDRPLRLRLPRGITRVPAKALLCCASFPFLIFSNCRRWPPHIDRCGRRSPIHVDWRCLLQLICRALWWSYTRVMITRRVASNSKHRASDFLQVFDRMGGYYSGASDMQPQRLCRRRAWAPGPWTRRMRKSSPSIWRA